jgi:hypothetical protein
MGLEPVKLGSFERPVFESNPRLARHLTPSPNSEPLDQVSANPNRGTSGESLRIPDPADYREVHQASLPDRFTRLVKCRRNQTAAASDTCPARSPHREHHFARNLDALQQGAIRACAHERVRIGSHRKAVRLIPSTVGFTRYPVALDARPAMFHEPLPPEPPKPRLLDRVREAIRARHYGRRTEKSYVA